MAERRDEGAQGGEATGRGEARGGTTGEPKATEVEREGMDLLGRSGVRDDAIAGVSDDNARADQDVDTYREDIGEGDRP